MMPQFLTRYVNQTIIQPTFIDNGLILFTPTASKKTYLIDSTGFVNHSWSSNYYPGLSVYMLNDKSILRTIRLIVGGSGISGGVEKYSYDGTLLWHFEHYAPNEYQSHHDIEPLPNGNVLILAFELKKPLELINVGRNPNQIPSSNVEFDYIIEVKPTSPTSGEIVWEWHSWDHLIQDYDSEKINYGVIAHHPELININFETSNPDWLHCNSIDYNSKFDQILLSSKNFNEIWVIDHSTTTEQAASHIGGNSGKGGDLLYRWGNPASYDIGTTIDQKLFGQHDAQWVLPGYPGEGNILIFNNGIGRQYSSVDEISTPVDSQGNYHLDTGSSYGPFSLIWSYTETPILSFYSSVMSGCQRLLNGNTLICDGLAGRFFEVRADKTTVWEYINPYPNPVTNDVFKIQYIPPTPSEPNPPDLECEGSFHWTEVNTNILLSGNFFVENAGATDSFLNWTIDTYPNWGNWTFYPESGTNLTPDDGQVPVHITVRTPNQKNSEFEGYIRVINQDNPDDFDVIPVRLSTQQNSYIIFFIKNFLRNHAFLAYLLHILD